MSIEDYIKPLEEGSKLGIPEPAKSILKYIKTDSNDALKSIASDTYNYLLEMIKRGMNEEYASVEEEEKAGEHLGHIILDAAYVHNACCRAGIELGCFPYDYLVDKLFPPAEELDKEEGTEEEI